jgi:hypothetical protein
LRVDDRPAKHGIYGLATRGCRLVHGARLSPFMRILKGGETSELAPRKRE